MLRYFLVNFLIINSISALICAAGHDVREAGRMLAEI